MNPRVLLLSTVHPPGDPRIRSKIAASLASYYDVFCVLPKAKAAAGEHEITLLSLPFFKKLTNRLLLAHPMLLWKCLRLRPRIVHIFVPELIPAAFLFQWLGASVIYEVQENMYKKFSIKTFNNHSLYQCAFRFFDQLARQHFRCIFTEDAYLSEYNNLRTPRLSCTISFHYPCYLHGRHSVRQRMFRNSFTPE